MAIEQQCKGVNGMAWWLIAYSMMVAPAPLGRQAISAEAKLKSRACSSSGVVEKVVWSVPPRLLLYKNPGRSSDNHQKRAHTRLPSIKMSTFKRPSKNRRQRDDDDNAGRGKKRRQPQQATFDNYDDAMEGGPRARTLFVGSVFR
jgi:hypothetical protein